MPRISVNHPNLFVSKMWELAKKEKFSFGSNPARINPANEWDHISCGLKNANQNSQFQVQQMPGCCAVLIVHHVNPNPYTPENFDALLQIIERGAYDAGFGSLLMAQVRHTEIPEDEIYGLCFARDWMFGQVFINAKSGNRVAYLMKNLNQPGKRKGFEF